MSMEFMWDCPPLTKKPMSSDWWLEGYVGIHIPDARSFIRTPDGWKEIVKGDHIPGTLHYREDPETEELYLAYDHYIEFEELPPGFPDLVLLMSGTMSLSGGAW